VDGSGRTVYLFEADKGLTSSCYDQCAKFWPPVTSTGTAVSATGVMASLVGAIARTDGTTQVIYKGTRCTTSSQTRRAATPKGQGLNNFGGGWYVVTAAGDKIDKS
jgi:predicted lipoprotein with Yx(FWY)xxD motif